MQIIIVLGVVFFSIGLVFRDHLNGRVTEQQSELQRLKVKEKLLKERQRALKKKLSQIQLLLDNLANDEKAVASDLEAIQENIAALGEDADTSDATDDLDPDEIKPPKEDKKNEIQMPKGVKKRESLLG